MKQGTLGIDSLFLENIQHLTLERYFVVTSGTAVKDFPSPQLNLA